MDIIHETKQKFHPPTGGNPLFPDAPGLAIPPGTPFIFNRKRHHPPKGWLLLVRCPYCAKEHYHGWGPGQDDEIQTRVSHCGKGDEYNVFQTGIYSEGGQL